MRFIPVIILLLSLPVLAEDDLTVEAASFIEKNENESAQKCWAKWWVEHAEQLQKDNNLAGEEQAADRYLTEWFRARADRFKARKDITIKEKLTVCHFYMLYKRNGWFIPERIAEHITKKTYDEVFVEKTP